MSKIKQHRTSLKDLAKELNVSIATVSRALRSSTEIGEEMQHRVKEPESLRTKSSQRGSQDYRGGGAEPGDPLLCRCP